MTETEKLFQELYPDFCTGDKCLSPYFDIFDTALELNENKIEELQEKKTCWKNCEYANPKAELIQYYIFEKEKEKELQKKVENLQKYLDTRNCYRECAETWEKLTEAKEIIREILSRPDGEISYETRAKAEAFIKEHEK